MRIFPHAQYSQLLHHVRNPPGGQIVWQVFFFLALIDVSLVVAHAIALVLQFFHIIEAVPWALSVFHDNSPAERTNYVKWLAIVGLLLASWLRLRIPALLALAMIFGLVLADDALRVHETGAAMILSAFPRFPDLGHFTRHAAEMLVWAGLGMVVVPVGLWGFLRSDQQGRDLASYMVIGFAAAVFAGIGLDTFGEAAKLLPEGRPRNVAQNLAGLVECLGESLSASLSLAFAIGIAATARSASLVPGLLSRTRRQTRGRDEPF
jgi:hypothetical protein